MEKTACVSRHNQPSTQTRRGTKKAASTKVTKKKMSKGHPVFF
ncbi:MAG: hypothetical protein ACQCN6_01445 [Candidatus Bathyarchaeia archaeon]